MPVIFKLSTKRICGILAIVFAMVHGLLAVSAVKTKSPTFDEPTHFAAGYSYWLRNDFRLDPEGGNLPQRWAALPLLFDRPNFPAADSAPWQSAAQGEIGTRFLYELGHESDALLLRGRMMMALISVALCLVVYFWSASIFGPLGGLIAAMSATFCPTLLANGALVTSDVALAFFFALAVWVTWRMLHRLTLGSFVAAGASVAGVFLSKMSGGLIVIMIGIMLAVRLVRGNPLEVRLGLRVLERRRMRQTLVCVAALGAVGAIVIVAIWSAYSFRFCSAPPGDLYEQQLAQQWKEVTADDAAAARVIGFARVHRLLPEAYLFGLAYVHANSKFRPAFLDGSWSVVGFPDFFWRSFLYKTPLPLLGLFVLSIFVIFAWRRRVTPSPLTMSDLCYQTTPVWTLLVVYGAFAVTARLNIGHRHILPLYPAIFVCCGACGFFFRDRSWRWAAAIVSGLLLWHAGEAVAIAPHYLAYFNEAAGGARSGYKHLVDSSLDWGQDLPALKHWLDDWQRLRGDQRPVYLAYFGTARPEYYGIHALTLGNDLAVDDGRIETLRAGLYCLSATALQQVYARPMGIWARPYEELYQALRREFSPKATSPSTLNDKQRAELRVFFYQLRFARLCAYLRHHEPIAQPGYSILIFDLSEADLKQALEGPPVELVALPLVGGLDELQALQKQQAR